MSLKATQCYCFLLNKGLIEDGAFVMMFAKGIKEVIFLEMMFSEVRVASRNKEEVALCPV